MQTLALGSVILTLAIVVAAVLITISPIFIWHHLSSLRKELKAANQRTELFQKKLLKLLADLYPAE